MAVDMLSRHFPSLILIPICSKYLERLHIVVVPCLNPIGASAGARSCPKKGTLVTLDERGKVCVAGDEKGGIKVPSGWADANVGWETNDTTAKFHAQKLLEQIKPKFVIWNHDWAPPQSMLKLYSDAKPIDFASLRAVEDLLGQHYPSKTIFGTKFNFLVQANQTADSHQITWKICEEYGIPSYVVEQYLFRDDAPVIHAAVDLILCMLHLGLDSDRVAAEILSLVKTSVGA